MGAMFAVPILGKRSQVEAVLFNAKRLATLAVGRNCLHSACHATVVGIIRGKQRINSLGQ
jgi:hypothetical protein